ncbi:MAG: hypothetical protein LC754_00545 [Acidobacteria bacterium]|nr:hypothetical protein [Acidobacteriota bacterium]
MRRFFNIIALLSLAAFLVVSQFYSPRAGCAFSPVQRAWARLKNRDELPQAADFDDALMLEALLRTGDDRAHRSQSRAARVEGYVVAVEDGGVEAANCFSRLRRDTHIEVALQMNAPPSERVILEVTPRMREWAAGQGMDWSTQALKRALVGRRCRFEGWLFFDEEHANAAENTAPGRADNWRATAWELHPLTHIEVVR